MSQIFKNGLKRSPNNNTMGVSAEFSKFPGVWEENRKNCDVSLWWRNNLLDYVSPKKIHKQVAYWLLVGRGEIRGYFCSISYMWSLKLCNLCNRNLFVCFRMSG